MIASDASTHIIEEAQVSDVWGDATDQDTWKRGCRLWGPQEEHGGASSLERPIGIWFWRRGEISESKLVSLISEEWTLPELRKVRTPYPSLGPSEIIHRGQEEAISLLETMQPSVHYRSVPFEAEQVYIFRLGSSSVASDLLQNWTSSTESIAPPESGTAQALPAGDYMRDVDRLLTTLAGIGTDEEVESEFARAVSEVVLRYGAHAVCEISHRIQSGDVDPAIAEYVFRALGDIDQEETRKSRLWVLKQALQSPSPAIRDGANVGIAFIDDPEAIPALREAIEREQSPLLRKLLSRTLAQLENTTNASLPA